MRRLSVRVASASVALVLGLAASDAMPAVQRFTADLPSGQAGATVTVRPTRSAEFVVVMTVPVGARVQLSLAGKGAPRGVLIDTATAKCPRVGRTRTCRAAYEPLPKGRYTWTITKPSGRAAKIGLVIRW